MKWTSKDDPRLNRESEPEPIRIEKKMIHGQLVEVKVYRTAFVPHDGNEAASTDNQNEVDKAISEKTSPIWTWDKNFD